MMKRTILLIVVLSLTACGGMSRQEVIQAVKECHDGGLAAAIVTNGLTYTQSNVICINGSAQ